MVTALAVDLGSSSGRVVAGTLAGGRVEEVEVRRFPHQARMLDGHLVWDLDFIWSEIVAGLRDAVARFPDAVSVSVDTCSVDHVPDADGTAPPRPRLPRPAHRPHPRGLPRPAERRRRLGRHRHRAGHINTANQLFAFLTEEPDAAAATEQVLLLPDYFTFLLSGERGWSRSHTSSSGLCRPGAREFSDEVLGALGIPRRWFGEVTAEHAVVGPCIVEGLGRLTVVRAGAHDTACAVHALQRDVTRESYFLSCGSWSVLGVLRDEPLLSEAAHRMGRPTRLAARPPPLSTSPACGSCRSASATGRPQARCTTSSSSSAWPRPRRRWAC